MSKDGSSGFFSVTVHNMDQSLITIGLLTASESIFKKK